MPLQSTSGQKKEKELAKKPTKKNKKNVTPKASKTPKNEKSAVQVKNKRLKEFKRLSCERARGRARITYGTYIQAGKGNYCSSFKMFTMCKINCVSFF